MAKSDVYDADRRGNIRVCAHCGEMITKGLFITYKAPGEDFCSADCRDEYTKK